MCLACKDVEVVENNNRHGIQADLQEIILANQMRLNNVRDVGKYGLIYVDELSGDDYCKQDFNRFVNRHLMGYKMKNQNMAVMLFREHLMLTHHIRLPKLTDSIVNSNPETKARVEQLRMFARWRISHAETALKLLELCSQE